MKYLNIALLFILVACEFSEEKRLPNIVFVLTDDQGYGDLACHGNEWIQTPYLDRLHDESYTFTNFHVGTTCAPSRSGILSGNHCNRVGAWHTIMGRSMLSTRFKTLPKYLQEVGYNTSIFGKWHLGDAYPYRPQDRGFDEVLIHGGGGVGQTPDYWNNDYFDDTYFHNGVPEKFEGYCTDIWFEEAMKHIEETSGKGKPFFTYIATNAPHGPYHVPQKYIDPYADNENIPNPNFYGMISNVDDNVGKLRAFLNEKGIVDNTIFIYMTDNGSSSGARYDKEGKLLKGFNAEMRGLKGSEYEGGHRVPMFIHFPESMNIENQETDALVTYTDFMPTLLDLLNIEIDEDQHFDGQSIKPLLVNGNQEGLENRVQIADKQRVDIPVKWKNSSVMQNHWRLINNAELYDLSKDAGQRVNLINEYPDKAKELENAYEKWWESLEVDMTMVNPLLVGTEEENPTLLTAHDWMSTKNPPWNQNHIRDNFVGNGYWNVSVVKKGMYRVRLFRWPPSELIDITEDTPQGDEVSGGKPYAIGQGIDVISAKLTVGDQTLTSQERANPAYYEFELDLEEGHTKLQSWLVDKKSVERGAFYIQVERLEL